MPKDFGATRGRERCRANVCRSLASGAVPSGGMIRWVACAFGIAAIAAAPAAAAPAVRLATSGDACALDALPARVDALRGDAAIDPHAAAMVRVEVGRSGSHVTAAVTFEDADGGRRGPRRVEAASCDALLDALALVIAMGLPPD